ncbi:hypothetical protein GFD22_04935 [Bifidobacterium avesanii]|uniref:Uncharacterized protein n=1 Tax=Bifidobacterium avesanii TaxID=1798157 RepID=A0A7K3TGV5_9BIFI|nr:hypothetical protein [Bifidobacterium avesanii]
MRRTSTSASPPSSPSPVRSTRSDCSSWRAGKATTRSSRRSPKTSTPSPRVFPAGDDGHPPTHTHQRHHHTDTHQSPINHHGTDNTTPGTITFAGPIGEGLTDERLESMFGIPLHVERTGQRWRASHRLRFA